MSTENEMYAHCQHPIYIEPNTPLTPDVPGWRAPNQPVTVPCCQPQNTRSWDLENLVQGMETIIQPLLEGILTALGGAVTGSMYSNITLTGAAFQILDPVMNCKQITFLNNTGVDIVIKKTPSGNTQIVIPNGVSHTVAYITNTADVQIKRADGLGVPVIIYFEIDF